MTYNPDNPFDTHEQLDPPKNITEEEAEEAESSDGSYNASDVSADDEDFEEPELEKKEVLKTAADNEIRSI